MNNYREMYEALLRGKTLQNNGYKIHMDTAGNIVDDGGCTVHVGYLMPESWSIKPKTININGFEVPEPVREPLKEGEDYWLVNMDDEHGFVFSQWRNKKNDNFWLSKGMIHRSEAAAVLHTNALWSFTAKEGV